MAGTPFDLQDIHRHVAEGRADAVLERQAKYGAPNGPVPTFLRFVILEVISDPSVIDSAKLSHWEHDLGVANTKYASVAPRNSIIARRVMGQDSGASEKVMVLYPFFPPHIAFPAKAGEHVWVMFEHPDAKVNDLGYWFCRIAQPSFVEDQNYTHADRQFDPSFLPGLSDLFEGTAQAKYEFPNGAVDQDATSGERYVAGGTTSLPGDNTVYNKLLQNTDAAKTTQFEAVPRYRKRPPELALEGSNNTLLVLGTDRTGPLANYTHDPNQGQIPGPVSRDTPGPGAGAAGIVVGRGQTPATGGKPETNVLGNKELGKAKPDLAPQEGDPDPINDRSTMMAYQKTKPDTNFGIATVVAAHSSQSQISDGNGEGAIVIKTDKVRLISRHDVVILVSAAGDKDNNGNVKDPGAAIDPSKCASVIIRINGDIVFTPAANGVIRLGGDDATLSPLCTRVGNTPGMEGPIPPPSPIVDSMGGTQGGSDGLNGVFATKVLLK